MDAFTLCVLFDGVSAEFDCIAVDILIRLQLQLVRKCPFDGRRHFLSTLLVLFLRDRHRSVLATEYRARCQLLCFFICKLDVAIIGTIVLFFPIADELFPFVDDSGGKLGLQVSDSIGVLLLFTHFVNDIAVDFVDEVVVCSRYIQIGRQ